MTGFAIGQGFGRTLRSRVGGAPPPGLTENKRVLIVGDSTDYGVGAGTPAPDEFNDCRLNSISYRMADALVVLGVAVSREAIVGPSDNPATNWAAADPRIAQSGLTIGSETNALGTSQWRFGSGTSGHVTFTPAIDVDTFDLWVPRRSGNGTMAVEIDGVVVGTINQAAATDFFKTRFTTTLGPHSFKIRNSSGLTWIGPIIAFNSAVSTLQIINGGWRNSHSGDWTAAAFPHDTLNALAVVAPHLSIIGLGINDARNGGSGVSVATFQTRLQTIIDTCRISGGVILRYPTAIAGGSYRADFTKAQLDGVYDALAAANGLPLLDTLAATGSYTTMNAASEVYDTFHLRAAPYQRVGAALAPMVKSFFGL